MRRFLDDLLVIFGSGCIVAATFLLNLVAGLYVLGLVLIAFGVLIGIGDRSSRK